MIYWRTMKFKKIMFVNPNNEWDCAAHKHTHMYNDSLIIFFSFVLAKNNSDLLYCIALTPPHHHATTPLSPFDLLQNNKETFKIHKYHHNKYFCEIAGWATISREVKKNRFGLIDIFWPAARIRQARDAYAEHRQSAKCYYQVGGSAAGPWWI